MLEVYTRRLRLVFFLLLLAAAVHYVYRLTLSATDTTLIPTESNWKYLDDGTTPDSSWKEFGFSDTSWRSGSGRFGYGLIRQNTTLRFGGDSERKYTTTYFRKTFSVSNPLHYKALRLRLLVDGGAIVYLNGTEVLRWNMPVRAVTAATPANERIERSEEIGYQTFNIANTLMTGTNVLAVELHQRSTNSSNLSFDASLLATETVSLTRPPYLQMMSTAAVSIRWQTNIATNSLVRFGSSPTSLGFSATNTSSVTDHEIRIGGLSANTKYYYSVGSTTTRLAGADSAHFFFTPPLKGSTFATRIWVIGDSGTGNSNAADVRNAYTNFNGSRYTNIWLMLGDNAYDSGTAAEYTAKVFNFYPNLLRQTVLWSCFGNHDGFSSDSSTQSGPYYSAFTFPRSGQAGGLGSNTEAYYSFDFANIHFVVLDSEESNRSPTGPMMTWLKNDIANTTQKWLIAIWHSPPYSHGGHNSDTEYHLAEMRKYANPILENRGVDLVLGGHSHDYERSFLIDGHYGTSDTFTSSMKINGGNGRTDGSGAYRKGTYGLAPHQGAVYIVMGSSGKLESGGALDYPAMYYSTATLGSVVLDVNGNRLDAKMLSSTGVIKDYFTIIKGSTSSSAAPAPPSGLTATAISSGQINLAWLDNSTTESGFKIERSPDGATFTQIATVGSNIKTFSNSGLAASKKYYYRVRAYNSGGNSGYSNIASAITPGIGLPAAPTNLKAAAVSSSQISLTWQDNSGNESGFKIERSVDGTSFGQIAVVGVNVKSFSNSGLASGKKYYYRVRAYNANGNSLYSNTANATTGGSGNVPAAPSSLSATSISSSQINLHWTDNSGNESGFKIERSTDGTTFSQIATTGSNSTGYSNTGLAASKKYYYRVRAYNGNGNSAYSNIASATTSGSSNLPAAPSGLTASVVSKNKITLNWTDNSGNESGFKIERSTNGTTFSQITTVAANTRTFTDTGLKFATNYYYRVRAYNSSGNSSYSNTASATTPAH